MFCPECGKQIPDGIKFCPECGAAIPTDAASSASQEISASTQEAQAAAAPMQEQTGADVKKLAEVVGKNAKYYLPEFEKAARGEKTRFNLAAFFLALLLCFYRKSGDIFKKYLLLPLIITFVGGDVLTVGTASFNTVLMAIGGIACAAAGLWSFINLIRLGKNFNKDYYNHCKQAAAANDEKKYGTSFGLAAIATIVFIIVVTINSLISGAISASAFNAAFDTDDTDDYDFSSSIAADSEETVIEEAPASSENEAVVSADEDYYVERAKEIGAIEEERYWNAREMRQEAITVSALTEMPDDYSGWIGNEMYFTGEVTQILENEYTAGGYDIFINDFAQSGDFAFVHISYTPNDDDPVVSVGDYIYVYGIYQGINQWNNEDGTIQSMPTIVADGSGFVDNSGEIYQAAIELAAGTRTNYSNGQTASFEINATEAGDSDFSAVKYYSDCYVAYYGAYGGEGFETEARLVIFNDGTIVAFYPSQNGTYYAVYTADEGEYVCYEK